MTEVRKYWLTATNGATTAREWFTVCRDDMTDRLFGGELDRQAVADGAFQVMRLTGDDDEMIAHAFQVGRIELTTEDGTVLEVMPAKV